MNDEHGNNRIKTNYDIYQYPLQRSILCRYREHLFLIVKISNDIE